jgi:hypothetical protein
MRNFVKMYKKNMLLLIGTILVYVLLISVSAAADEQPPLNEESQLTENMSAPLHVLREVHNSDGWLDRPIIRLELWEIQDLRIQQILRQDAIVRPLLESPELQTIKQIYERKLEVLMNRWWYDFADIEALLGSTHALQDIILQAKIYEVQNGFNHWKLALSAMQIGLLAAIVVALIWRR